MTPLKWNVMTITEAATQGPAPARVYVVQLQLVPNGEMQGGQLTLRLTAPPSYHVLDVIEYPPAPVMAPARDGGKK
jgi:hypothetical protein